MNRDQIHENYTRQIDRIQNSKVYSDHAKRVMVAKAYQEAQATLEQLRQNEVKAIEDQREQLHRKMFGRETTADAQTVIIRRDANDRAAKIDSPRDAAGQLQTAIRQGDRTMAQAIAQHAADFGWTDVLNSYADYQPGFRETAEEFNGLPDTSPSSEWSIHHSFSHVVAPPAAIANMPSHHIARLANEDMEAAS